MGANELSRMARTAARLAADDAADADLVGRFVATADPQAFAALARRHGPMVYGVCRRVLGDVHAADDAFQATFVALARRAAAVRPPDRVAAWLYGTACRTARRARRSAARRSAAERRAASHVRRDGPADPAARAEAADLSAALDAHLAALPATYRDPVVLCLVCGLDKATAAARLGLPEGTVSSRLARGRVLLRDRLTRAGLGLPAAGLAAVAFPTAVPGRLMAAATTAAAGVVPAAGAVGLFVHGWTTMTTIRVLAVAAVAAGGGGWVAIRGQDGARPAAGDRPVVEVRPAAGDTVAELVKRLGSPGFADREQADRDLRNLGPDALPALTAASAAADDPEVRARLARVIADIRRADVNRQIDRQLGQADPDPRAVPGWAAFRQVAGDTPAARRLYRDILADPANRPLLAAADGPPDALAREVARRRKVWNEADKALWISRPPNWRDLPPPADEATLAAQVFGEGLTGPAFASTDASHLFLDRVALFPALKAAAVSGPAGEPWRRLLSAWVDATPHPFAAAEIAASSVTPAAHGLTHWSRRHKGDDVALDAEHWLPAEAVERCIVRAAANRLCPRGNNPFILQIAARRYCSPEALAALTAQFGNPLRVKTLGWESDLWPPSRGGKGVVEYTTGDVALAVALLLTGQEPTDYGFVDLGYLYAQSRTPGGKPTPADLARHRWSIVDERSSPILMFFFHPDAAGSREDKRKAAFAKWDGWAAEHRKAWEDAHRREPAPPAEPRGR